MPRLSQTLVYARAFVTVPGLLAFARFTLFQSGFVWHDLDWLYDVALLHKLRPLCNTPHPNKGVAQARHALRHEGAVGIGLKVRFGKRRVVSGIGWRHDARILQNRLSVGKHDESAVYSTGYGKRQLNR
jgi:hypothetical protein